MTVASTHFGLNPSEQGRMLSALLPIMEAEPTLVLLGDFNARPDAAVLSPIHARMTDVAQACKNASFTFSSIRPDRRIDYIFLSSDLAPVSFDVPQVICSDHLPLIGDFAFKNDKM